MAVESDILLPQNPGASGWRPPSEQEITLARSNLDLPPPAQEVAVLPSIDDEAVARARANLGEPPQTVAMPMETAPQQQSVLGPEADVSVDALGQIRGSIQDQAADRIRAMIAGQVVSSPNAMYGPTKQYIGAEKETDTRLRGALDQQGQVEQLRMQEEATAYASEAARMQARNDAAEQIEMQRRERMIEQEKVMQDASKQYADAVTKFASAPPVDPDRYWASKSAGFKFIARLASGLNALGGAGPAEAMAHITNAIREDIDAQKANRGALGEQAQLTGTQYSQATSTYNQLLSTLQDERMADTVMENARLEEARAQLDRIVAGYAPKSKDAQHQALLAEIDKQQAQNNLRLAQLSANNPRVISRRVSNMSPLELKLQEKVLDSELKQGEGVTSDVGKILVEGTKGAAEAQKRQVMTPENFNTALERYATRRGEHEVMDREISAFLQAHPDDTDIPGVDPNVFLKDPERPSLLNPGTERGRMVNSFIQQQVNAYRKVVTGAGASDAERQDIENALLGARTEPEVRAAMRKMQNSARKWMEVADKGTNDQVIEHYNRNISGSTGNVSSFKPK